MPRNSSGGKGNRRHGAVHGGRRPGSEGRAQPRPTPRGRFGRAGCATRGRSSSSHDTGSCEVAATRTLPAAHSEWTQDVISTPAWLARLQLRQTRRGAKAPNGAKEGGRLRAEVNSLAAAIGTRDVSVIMSPLATWAPLPLLRAPYKLLYTSLI